MIKVIGVRFRTAGKIYFFDPVAFDIKKGDHVIVETARGIEFGTVMSGVREVTDDEIVQPLKPVLRIATERDIKQEAENKLREKEAYRVCLEKIREHSLDMKLVDAEYTFDNNKVLFYFTADGRIDFRDLVKDLAAIFKTRIELRQIGVRDEAKLRGGIGMCGRPLCCHTHLADFLPVSIKMTKEQNLSLNPTKISGVCGRLMCCLKHEADTYEELNRNLPNIGDRVTGPEGVQGEVSSVNVLRQLVKVVIENGESKEIREFKVEDLRFVKKGHRHVKEDVSAEELRELELMEKQDKLDNAEEDASSGKQSRKDRNDRKDRRDKSDREDRKDRADREERKSKSDREDRRSKADREERRGKSDREDRKDKGEHEERRTGAEPGSRVDSADREERGERSERSERNRNRRNRNRVERQEGSLAEREGAMPKGMESGSGEQIGSEQLKHAERAASDHAAAGRETADKQGERGERSERNRNRRNRNRSERQQGTQTVQGDALPQNTEGNRTEQTDFERNPNNDKQEERGERSERSERNRSHKNRNRDGQGQDRKPAQNEELTSEATQGKGAEGEGADHNSHKRHHYRNRRRNRPEGAGKQNES